MTEGTFIPGKMSFKGTFKDTTGHFEKGRWVDLFTRLSDAFPTEQFKEPTFEITGTVMVPVFKQGACVDWKELSIPSRTVTQSELKRMFPNYGSEIT